MFWSRKRNPPDCTLRELLDEYLAKATEDEVILLWISPKDFNRFLSDKLFEGKLVAWGKEASENPVLYYHDRYALRYELRVSSKVVAIPRKYWKFNRIAVRIVQQEQEIVSYDYRSDKAHYYNIEFDSGETTFYVQLEFNKKQLVKQIHEFVDREYAKLERQYPLKTS